jgi:hypothetical protein
MQHRIGPTQRQSSETARCRKRGRIVMSKKSKFRGNGSTLQQTGATAPYPSQIYGISSS